MMHHSVYVIQLGESPSVVYVGLTGLTREERLAAHETVKGAKVCRRYVSLGQRLYLRPDLYPPNSENLSYNSAAALEKLWAEHLREKGLIVYGGT